MSLPTQQTRHSDYGLKGGTHKDPRQLQYFAGQSFGIFLWLYLVDRQNKGHYYPLFP